MNPVPATKQDASSKLGDAFLLLGSLSFDILAINEKTELIIEVRYCRFNGLIYVVSLSLFYFR